MSDSSSAAKACDQQQQQQQQGPPPPPPTRGQLMVMAATGAKAPIPVWLAWRRGFVADNYAWAKEGAGTREFVEHVGAAAFW
jgi:hypothetical protein